MIMTKEGLFIQLPNLEYSLFRSLVLLFSYHLQASKKRAGVTLYRTLKYKISVIQHVDSVQTHRLSRLLQKLQTTWIKKLRMTFKDTFG
jgi:hypothetical protein